ncbi:LysR family transcriptional regulator [Novosphingobium beihaiensis]|uniref:LysR family transcriptional regulator n=1 Tax=Novosphingobium beihaiensis TaxID=2930389 RepID=A0ABT0BL16_9SPHN|nr:LysR family transcriptional regulator [Novosphingobium beihaiensis]MCJ2185756.1 LysR family transcriptional regulator [Novosphingobium beihaiensis]
MSIGRTDIADFSYFLAIARHGSFRRAALELGVSPSALSHSLRGLETRLGVRLLNRTNRSVTLTAAGEELRDAIAEPFSRIDQARDALNRFRDTPMGRIRLNVASDAAILLLAPVMPVFMDRYPDVEVDIVASNRLVDVVGSGFDAGIRYGGTVPEDMIAQRLSGDIRWMVAGAPAYFERFGMPEEPASLKDHRCLGVRLGDDRIYRWEFEGPDGEFDIAVPSMVTVDDSRSMLTMALGGGGLMFGPEPVLRPHLADGSLKAALDSWATTGPGFQIYYPSRRQLPTGLRLLINLIRELDPLGC